MITTTLGVAATGCLPLAAPGQIENLRRRVDSILGELHGLTKRLDRREITAHESLCLELPLVIKMGQVQDRLRLLGCHAYDGCEECRPLSGDLSKGNSHVA